MLDKPSNASALESSPTDSLGGFLLTQINPIDQFKIAGKIARDPSYLKEHPQDALIPALYLEIPLAHVATTLYDVGADGVGAMKEGCNAVSHNANALKDLLELDFGKAGHEEWEAIKAEGRMLWDVAKMPIDLVKQPAEHLWEAGKDLVCTPLNIAGDGINAVKDQLDVVKNGAQCAEDLLSLNFSGAWHDVKEVAKAEVNTVKDVVMAPVHLVEGIGKSILDLF